MLTTCRNANDKSIEGDMSVVRYEIESQNISKMVWMPGKLKLTDAIAKQDSAIANFLRSLLDSAKLPLSFDGSKGMVSTISLGWNESFK